MLQEEFHSSIYINGPDELIGAQSSGYFRSKYQQAANEISGLGE